VDKIAVNASDRFGASRSHRENARLDAGEFGREQAPGIDRHRAVLVDIVLIITFEGFDIAVEDETGRYAPPRAHVRIDRAECAAFVACRGGAPIA